MNNSKLAETLHALASEVAKLRAEFRTLRDECHEDMERAYRERRAAAERARRAGAANQGPQGHGEPAATPTAPAPSAWGARRRRIERMETRRARANGEDTGEDTDGVHP